MAIYCWSSIWRGLPALREAGVPFYLIIGILALLFMLFSNSIHIVSHCHFYHLFLYYHCVRYLHVILQWYWFIVVDFITCSGYFRLNVCARDIFLAYIHRRLSSRLRSSVFWEVEYDRFFLVSEPDSTFNFWHNIPCSYVWPEMRYIHTTIYITIHTMMLSPLGNRASLPLKIYLSRPASQNI